MPSRSAIKQPRCPQTSSSGYQSEQLRARRVTSIDKANLAKSDARDQVLKSSPVGCGSTALPKITVNHIDIRLAPSETASALREGVLKLQAFLIGDHLVWRRLPDIHHRFAVQVIRFYEFRAHRSSPAGLGRFFGDRLPERFRQTAPDLSRFDGHAPPLS